MGIFDNLVAAQQDPYSDILAPKKTLLQTKQELLASKMVEKEDNFDPNIGSLAAYDELTRQGGEDIGLLDLAEASLYRGAGNIADVGKDVSNAIFGSEFDSAADTGYSNPELADIAAGVSPEDRQAFQAKQGQVLTDVAEGDYWSAAKNAAAVGLPTLADSAASLAEIAIGTAAAPIAGAGAGLLAKKAKDITKGIVGISNAYSKAEEAVAAKKAAKTLSKSMEFLQNRKKDAARTSLMTADMVQQQRNEYKEQNNGEEPSAARLATMVVTTSLLASLEVPIINKLFVPKVVGKAKVLDKAGKQVTDPKLREQFVAEAKRMMNYVEEGTLESIGKRVLSGTGKVFAAGGAEAAQEYAQTWGEILSVKVGNDEAQGLVASMIEEITDMENRNQATTGAFLGGAAGGAGKAVISGPAVAGGAIFDTGKGITKAAAKQLDVRRLAKGNKLISAEKQEEIRQDHELREKVHKELEADRAQKIDALSTAKSIDDVTDEDIRRDLVKFANNQNLNDPEVFENALHKTIRNFGGQVKASAVKLQAVTAGKQAKEAGTAVVREIGKKVNVSKEDIERVAKKAKALGIEAIEEIKDFENSGTIGLVEAAIEYGGVKGKEGQRMLVKAVKNSSPAVIESVAKAINNQLPDTAIELRKLAASQEKFLEQEERRNASLIDYESIPETIREMAAVGKIHKGSISSALYEILDTAAARFEDTKSIDTMEKAIAAYENSASTEDLDKYSARLKSVKKKLANSRREIDDTVIKKTAAKIKETVTEAVDKFTPGTVEAFNKLGKKGEEAIESLDLILSDVVSGQKRTRRKITDPGDDSIKYTVNLTETGVKFAEGLMAMSTDTKGAVDEDAARKALEMAADDLAEALVSTPALVVHLANHFGVSDPKAVMALLVNVVPTLSTKERYSKLLEVAEKALKPAEEIQVTEVEETGKVTVDKNDDNVPYQDTKASKDLREIFINEVLMKAKLCP